jgi:hypothetical protein
LPHWHRRPISKHSIIYTDDCHKHDSGHRNILNSQVDGGFFFGSKLHISARSVTRWRPGGNVEVEIATMVGVEIASFDNGE